MSFPYTTTLRLQPRFPLQRGCLTHQKDGVSGSIAERKTPLRMTRLSKRTDDSNGMDLRIDHHHVVFQDYIFHSPCYSQHIFRPFPSVQPYTCNANANDALYLASFIFRYIQLEILILGASKAFVPSSATYINTGKLRATQKRKFGSKPP